MEILSGQSSFLLMKEVRYIYNKFSRVYFLDISRGFFYRELSIFRIFVLFYFRELRNFCSFDPLFFHPKVIFLFSN